MKARVIAIVLFFTAKSGTTHAQRYFADYIEAGTSFTYLPFVTQDVNKNLNGFIEMTWNVNLGMRFSKRVFSGIQLLNIYSSEVYTKRDYYNLYGVFVQYNLISKKEPNRFFIETSINRSNYCLCGELPSYRDKIPYLGIGAGFDRQIKKVKNLFLDLSFISYNNLQKVENKTAYNIYILGLNYRIGGGD